MEENTNTMLTTETTRTISGGAIAGIGAGCAALGSGITLLTQWIIKKVKSRKAKVEATIEPAEEKK